MGKPNYRVSLPDLTFYQATVACQYACPCGTDIRGYIKALNNGASFETACRPCDWPDHVP